MTLDLSEKIVRAGCACLNGDPIKDYLDDSEIEEAVKTLADILIATGVSLPED